MTSSCTAPQILIILPITSCVYCFKGVIWPKVQAWSFFDVNCIFYHITRLPAEFEVKWTPLVAWEGAQPLVLASFGINSPRMPSRRPNHTSLYPQNTVNILLICCSLILDVWRGSDFDPCWHPFCWIFQGKLPKINIPPTTECFHSNSFAMMFAHYKSTKTPEIM